MCFRCDPLEECKTFLANGKLKSAILIWERHQTEISRELDTEKICELLNSISNQWSIEVSLDRHVGIILQ